MTVLVSVWAACHAVDGEPSSLSGPQAMVTVTGERLGPASAKA